MSATAFFGESIDPQELLLLGVTSYPSTLVRDVRYGAEMQVSGYMVEVEFDGRTITAAGTNKAARIALAGERHGDGPVVIPVDEIGHVEFKKASPIANGRLVISTVSGSKYQLHFRRKSNEDFAALYDGIEGALS